MRFRVLSGVEVRGRVMFSLPGRERKSVVDSEGEVDGDCGSADVLDRERKSRENDRKMENISALCNMYIYIIRLSPSGVEK